MKKAYQIVIAFILGLNLASNACSPLNVPILLSSTVTATNLSLNWQSTTPYFCPDAIDVEIACSSMPFSGLGAYTFTSATITGNTNPYNYPTQNINISNLCPGAVYKYRARQRNNPGTTASGWTATFTFTMPGVFVPPTGNITATPPIITTCPQGNSVLAFNCSNCCGNPPYNYTWTPAASLSCSTCASPVATPVTTTIYTLNSTGGQLGCWALTNTVLVTVISTPPSIGTAAITPSVMCAGNTASVSISSFSGAIQWQSSPNNTGPWTNVSGATTGSFITAPLTNNTCYQALVTGCGGTLTSNAVCVTVNPSPTVTVSSATICAGSTASLTATGATSYVWSAGTTTTGVNTANASPLVTTSYTITGTTAGCTGTAVATVSVKPMPIPTATNNGPLCTGSNLNLTGGGGGTYTWSGPLTYTSALQNPTIVSTNTAQAGTYSLSVNLNGCISNTTTNVTITTPSASATNGGPYCAGATMQLNTPAATSYTWTGPNAYTSNIQNPTIANATTGMSGTYTVVTSVGSCTTLATTSVTVNALPTPTISNNGPICNGLTLNLTSGGAVTYTWSGPSGFTSQNQNPSIAIATPTNSGVYTVTVTDVNGCKNTNTTNVVVNPTPTISTIGSTVCAGQTFSLTANSLAGSSYLWSGPNSFTSNLQNVTVANSQTLMTGIYNLVVTSAASCTNTATANVVIIALPTPTITSNTPICSGFTLNFNVIGTNGATFSWNGPNGFTSAIQSPVINSAPVTASGIYTVIATAGICSVSTTQSITVNPLPNATAVNNAPICETGNIVLTGGGGTAYSWTGPNGFVSSAQSPSLSGVISSQSGNYVVLVTNANGCQAYATTSVTILANPTVLASGAVVCFGYSATLTATGGSSYLWSGPNGFSATGPNPVVPVINNNTMGTYNVIVTAANTCTSASAVNVSTYPLPVPTITATGKTCINTPVNLQGSPGFLLYQWHGPENFVSPNVSVTFTPTSMTQSGMYTLSVVDNRGCVGSTSTLVILDPLPNATISLDNNKKCIPFCSNFNLQNVGTASLVSSNWNFNGQTFNGNTLNYCITNSGDYLIKANYVDANGCPNSSTFTLNAYPIPTALFEYSPAKPIEVEDEVKFTDGSQGPSIVNWNWHFISNTGYQTTQQNPSYTFEKSGTYAIALVVTNKWGCSDTTMKTITIGEGNAFFVPNAFTPNGDGINDTFFAKGHNITKYEMTVFDRWGEKLFHTTDINGQWDGTFKGVDCKNDTYVWKISYSAQDAKVKAYTGHVTLNR